jgi:hypothetical protein
MMLGRGDSTKVVYRDGGILYFKRLECVTVTIKKVTKYAARFGGTSIARGDLETEKLNGR